MVIGIDASRANRDFKTGTEWYSYYLIKNLIEIDKENKYILYSDKPLSESFLDDLNLKENKHVKVKVLHWPFSFLWTLGRLSLEMIFHSPNVLFVPAHALPLIFPKKTINTIHDIAFLKNECFYDPVLVSDNFTSPTKMTKSLVRFFTLGKYTSKATDYLKWSTKLALKRAKKIITVSEFTKKEILKNYQVKNDKIAVVHNGFMDSLYKKLPENEDMEKILKKYGLDFPYFLYVGRMEKKKNIHRLIEGFSIFKERNKDSNIKLILAGRAGYGYDEMRYLIEEFALENDVLILGWVEEKDMPYIFNKAEAFVFPSLYEGFGIPVLQAMACGTPNILSDIDVLVEVAGRDNALFFDRFDVVDLAKKMEIIISDKELREKLINNGLTRAKDFSWRKCAEQTLKEIKQM